MKKIIAISILSLSLASGIMGCFGSARMINRTFDPVTGELLTQNEIRVKRIGSGKLNDVNVELVEGKAMIGKTDHDIGGLGSALEALIDRIPIPVP